MRIVVAALAALALAIPPADASHTIARCGAAGPVGHPVLTGSTYTAVVYGYAIGGPLEGVSVKCTVMAGGVPVTQTPWASGIGAAVTAGEVSWRAAGGATLCATWSDSHGGGTYCGPFAPL